MAKKPSRAQERQRLLDAAAAVQVPGECDVIVVGGGAAGLVAAITAAEVGASTLVLESDLECGRSILATGNGRCNFANVDLSAKRFNDPQFVEAVCGPDWLDDVLGFFRDCGLAWCLEEDRLYPASRVSASVRNVLLARARKAGVILAPARKVVDVTYIAPYLDSPEWELLQELKQEEREAGNDPSYLLELEELLAGKDPTLGGSAELACAEEFSQSGALSLPGAESVVLATGGGALPDLRDLELQTARLRPVLCPLACEDSPLAALDGRRAHVKAFLTKEGSLFPCWHERGEVLFRDYGLSGIVTFDLSRRAKEGDLVELDLAPDLSASQLMQIIEPSASGSFEYGCLDGVLDPQVATVLERLARVRWNVGWPERKVPKTDAEALVSLTKALPFRVIGPAKEEQAQVTRGGLCTSQFDPATLAARSYPWLFACGEALDIDADCGGFNLAWAWKSGMVAGAAAASWALARKKAS